MALVLSTIIGPRSQEQFIQPEDIEKAREIGVLTPTSTSLSDRDLPNGSSLVDEIDFLIMQERIESENKEMNDWISWTEKEEILLTSVQCEMGFCPVRRQQGVRITSEKGHYYFGTTDDNISVCIPKNILENLPPREGDNFQMIKYSIYMMDIIYYPVGRNMWRALKVYESVTPNSMLESVIEGYGLHSIRDFYTVTYTAPCPRSIVGKVIGRGGQNLTSMLREFFPFASPDDYPSINIEPIDDDIARISITLDQNNFIHASAMDITDMIIKRLSL